MPFEWAVALRLLREGRFQTVLILAGVMVFLLRRELGRPVGAVVASLTAMANGNYRDALPSRDGQRQDEIGQIHQALHGLQSGMRQTITAIQHSASTLNHAANQNRPRKHPEQGSASLHKVNKVSNEKKNHWKVSEKLEFLNKI